MFVDQGFRAKPTFYAIGITRLAKGLADEKLRVSEDSLDKSTSHFIKITIHPIHPIHQASIIVSPLHQILGMEKVYKVYKVYYYSQCNHPT